MKMRHLALAAGAATLIAAPAAIAHPSTYTYTTAKACTSTANCAAGTFTTSTRYAIFEHGYVTVLTESNSVNNRGVLNLAALPSGRRTWLNADPTRGNGYAGGLHGANWFTDSEDFVATWATPGDASDLTHLTGAADTGAQAHATCQGVSALTSGTAQGDANVLGWQTGHSNADPFFNYVPWQAAASGLDDKLDVAEWIRVDNAVLAAASVSNRVSTSSSVADFTAACTALGGTYKAADTTTTSISSASSGVVADATAPLNTQITDLQAQVATLQASVAQSASDAAASVAQLSPFRVAFTTAKVTRTSVATDGIRVTVSGPVGRTARVVVRTRERAAARLGLPVILGTAAGAPGTDGTVSLNVSPGKGALRRIQASKGTVPLIAEVLPADTPGTATGELGG